MLYIVSTPIGNLKDITLRAIEVLKSVDMIAAEDTRHSKVLLDAYDIQKPLTSFFEHNEDRKTEQIIGWLKQGQNIALITDAGTPGISDPGYVLIDRSQKEGIKIEVIPGVSALMMALTASGLPSHSFSFEGFFPVKSGGRRKKLEALKEDGRTTIFYESPHRLLKTLGDIAEILPTAHVVCARELTKKFEEIKKGTAQELSQHFSHHAPKGEFVVLISNLPA
jgi:16S rRNA (cytidine1402-2'-O)-methyltransferase